jgi:hypothetical protein
VGSYLLDIITSKNVGGKIMHTAKEYIMLSILSYCNFNESEYGKTILEVFQQDTTKSIFNGTFIIIEPKYDRFFLEYFKDILSEWKIYYVDNRTAQNPSSTNTGFYSVVFKKQEDYVVAFRGSEKYPLEDAYKDFIETDLALGLGKIPQQFYEGVEVYYKLIRDFKVPHDRISLTGHSLGGGIAQYVVLMVDKYSKYIPRTYIWNGVGINRDGIISVLDFIDLDKILAENTDLTLEEREQFKEFAPSYLEFLSKELKKIGAIKDDKTSLVNRYDDVYFNIDETFVKNLLKTTNLEKCFMKLPLSRRRELLLEKNFFDAVFQLDNMGELLEKAEKFIERVKNNVVYESRVFNFGHSKDLTNSLFKHVGSSYLIDNNFHKRTFKKYNFLNNLLLLTKSIQDHHFEDVFLPFIEDEGEKRGSFSNKLSLNFIASTIRKLITMEYCLAKEFLADYYSMVKINEQNFTRIKNQMIHGLENMGAELPYKKHIIHQINEMDMETFSKTWEKTKAKLPSPYRLQDIFDVFVFEPY